MIQFNEEEANLHNVEEKVGREGLITDVQLTKIGSE